MTPLNSEAAILNRLIKPESDDFPPETAHSILRFGFDEADLKRMEDLAAKARGGTLAEDEKVEIENYEHVSHMLALMQAKARRSLQKVGSSS